MIHGKIAYLGLAIALGYGLEACSSDTPATPAASTETGGSSNGGASTGGKAGGGTGGGSSGTGGGSTGGSNTGGGGNTEGGVPSIKIDDPTPNQTLTFGPGDDPDYPVKFTVTNFTLKAPGSTACDAGKCGHVHLYIDETACNDKTGAAPLPYNNAGAASPINAGFDYCPNEAGPHTIKVELHNNDHTSVMVANNKVNDSVDVTVVMGDGGTPSDGGAKDAAGQ